MLFGDFSRRINIDTAFKLITHFFTKLFKSCARINCSGDETEFYARNFHLATETSKVTFRIQVVCFNDFFALGDRRTGRNFAF